MIGTSYAWWTSTTTQSGINEIQSDCLSIAIEDENEISLQNAYPLTDEEAEKLKPYTFTIANKCNTKVNYIVKLEELKTKGQEDAKILKSEYVAIEVNGGQKQILSEYPTIESSYTEKEYESVEAKNIVNGTLEGNESKKYSLKLWMDEHVTLQDDATNKSFISKIIVEGGMNNLAEYTEPILHGADPVLESNKPVAMLTANEVGETTDKLIPVIIDENGTVTKASTKEEWYNYEEKKWANAVILVDNSKEYQDGEIIPEEQIESYFVWIPKYKYKLFDMGHYTSLVDTIEENREHAIEILFGDENTTNEGTTNGIKECLTPNESGADGNCEVGKWMTHPAFTAFEGSKGIWVGKFETGYKSAKAYANFYKNDACLATVNKTDATEVVIKPNVYSWRCINVLNAYKTSVEYQSNLQSHMMKNTEWGAVAYLTQSIYGRCDKKTGICEEVRINNVNNYLTGYAAKNAPETIYPSNDYGDGTKGQEQDVNANGNFKGAYNYKNKDGNIASTTGNYSGIYDMNGGVWEYVMGYADGKLNEIGLTEEATKNPAYFDKYNITKDTDFDKRILGDATGEVGPFLRVEEINGELPHKGWYEDWSNILSSCNVFIRGGGVNAGKSAGIFTFIFAKSGPKNFRTFRIVLAPQ